MVSIRPQVGANCTLPIELQITDVTVRPRPQSWRNGKPRKGLEGERVSVYVSGTTGEGFGVVLEVADFKPYVFIRVPEEWQSDDAANFVATLNKAHTRGRGEPMTGELLRRFHAVGYRPGPDGQPFRFNFVKVGFPTLRLRDAVCKHFKAAPGGTRRPGNDAMWTGLLRAMGRPHSPADLEALGDEVFTLHHDQIPHAQAFMNTVGVSASAWLRVDAGVLVAATKSPHKFSNMQIEVQRVKVADLHPVVERSTMAPMVILSFDIESYSESREFPKWWNPDDKIINVGMNFATCAGATKLPVKNDDGSAGGESEEATQPVAGDDGILRTVLCLGATGDSDDVHISTFDTEAELLSAFQERIADPGLDPDILLGYNIFDFDFMYLAQRAALITLMRQLQQKPWPEVQALWRSTRKKVAAFNGYADSYRACSDSDSKGKKAILQRMHAVFDTRGSRLPSMPSEPMLLGKYETAEELRAAWTYFGGQPSTTFNSCSRLASDVCTLQTHTLESSAMGSNELRRFDMAGRVCLDLWLHLKNGNSKLSSYSLSSVSQHFLGLDKADMPYNTLFDYYASGDPQKRAEIAAYCSRDCDLPILLVNKLGTISDLVEMSRVCRTPLPALTTRGQQVKVYSQLAFEVECAGAVLNTVSIAPPSTYVGATVIEPKPGYHDLPVATLDFASLYPSIMQANNIGPGSYVLPGDVAHVRQMAADGKVEINVISTASDTPQSAIANLHAKQRESQSPSTPSSECSAEDADASSLERVGNYNGGAGAAEAAAAGAKKDDDTTHIFVASTTYKGLVPKLLSKLLHARSEVKKQMKKEKDKFKYGMLNSKQLAIKISCNSVYGFFGVKAGYLPCWPVAACTTATGRRYIDQTKEAVESKYTKANGYPGDAEVVYGDTDSVMVKFQGVPRSMEGMKQAWKLAEEAADYVSDVTFAAEREIVLEAEKVYWPYMIWDTKKRYIGRCFMHPDYPPKIDAKGVELVRRDNAKLVRDIYGRLVEAIMPLEGAARSVEETREVVERHLEMELKRIVNDELPLSDYIITKSLKQGYKSDHLPHVQLVKKIIRRIKTGQLVREPPKSGQRIPYVIVQGKGQVYQRAEDPEWMTSKAESADQNVRKKAPKLDRVYYLDQQLKNALTKLTMYFHTTAKVFRDAEGAVSRQQGGNHSITNFFSAGAAAGGGGGGGGGGRGGGSMAVGKRKQQQPMKPSGESSSAECASSSFSSKSLDDTETRKLVAKRPRTADETKSVADKISARLAKAAASLADHHKHQPAKPQSRKSTGTARPKTAAASKRKMSSSRKTTPTAANTMFKRVRKTKQSILDSSSDDDDEEEEDEDRPIDYGLEEDDEDDFDFGEADIEAPIGSDIATSTSINGSVAQKSNGAGNNHGEGAQIAKTEGEADDDGSEEDSNDDEEEEDDDDEEEEEEVQETDPLDPESLENVAQEWFFRARSEILYPASTMLEQIKFFLAAPVTQASQAVAMMRRSRKAAPEEIEFWDALVAARSNGDVRIPTMAEVAAASKDPASAATANVAQATPEALGTSGVVPGADADGTPPRIDPGTRISVFWPLDDEWYSGTIGEFDNARGLHSITYDDDEHAWLDLSAEDFKVLSAPTQSKTDLLASEGSNDTRLSDKSEATGDDVATIASVSSQNERSQDNSDKAKSEAIVDPVEALRAKEEAMLQQETNDGNSLLNAHAAVHAAHAAEQRQVEDGEVHEEKILAQDPAVDGAVPTTEVRAAESPSGDENSAADTESEGSTADKSSESTPTTITASVGEMDKATVGRSKSVLKVLANLKSSSVDVTKLNNKYKQDISAAAALAATIAAYADEENDDSAESKMLSQEQSIVTDQADLDDQFDIGDMDFDDEDVL